MSLSISYYVDFQIGIFQSYRLQSIQQQHMRDFFVDIKFFVEMVCSLLDPFLMHHIDRRNWNAEAPFVFGFSKKDSSSTSMQQHCILGLEFKLSPKVSHTPGKYKTIKSIFLQKIFLRKSRDAITL